MGDEVLEEVTSLIEKQMGRYKKPIVRETCLEKDLGISGDDAVELLLDYSKKFDVDVSKFDIRKYFTPEGDTLLGFLSGKKGKKELTVGDLEKGVMAKQLNEDIITGRPAT